MRQAALTSIEKGSQDLRPPESKCVLRLARPLRILDSEQRDNVSDEVGEDVESVCDEGERARQKPNDDLEDEKDGSDGDDNADALKLSWGTETHNSE